MIDESIVINDKIHSQRLEQVLVTARRNQKIKMSLEQKKRKDSNSFEKDFLTRGNSSIRKEMQKFEAGKNLKRSIDQYSIYDSQNSLSLHRKSNLNPSRRVNNMKTEIK